MVIVCAEDDLGDTIVPRLLAHGADLSRIASVPLERDEHGHVRPLSLPEHQDRLELAIRQVDAKLLVIDPITAYLSETINTNNDASVRRATTPLTDLAQRTGTAILLVRHLNKSGELKAKYRGGGSIAFTGAARAVLVVEEHPEQPGLLGARQGEEQPRQDHPRHRLPDRLRRPVRVPSDRLAGHRPHRRRHPAARP